jgi:NTP pyrophosphatase (non-canonical NTP hydrolase)
MSETPAPHNGQSYQDLALRTLCPDDQIDVNRVHWGTFRKTLQAIAEQTQVLDAIKKTVVYNKPFSTLYDRDSRTAPRPAPIDPQIIHAVIGIVSEAGELAQALVQTLFEGAPLDLKNLREESGDIDWYQALLDSRVGYSQEQRWADNIAKLEKRYTRTSEAVAFTSQDALERDTAAELSHITAGPTGETGPVGDHGFMGPDDSNLNDLPSGPVGPVGDPGPMGPDDSALAGTSGPADPQGISEGPLSEEVVVNPDDTPEDPVDESDPDEGEDAEKA